MLKRGNFWKMVLLFQPISRVSHDVWSFCWLVGSHGKYGKSTKGEWKHESAKKKEKKWKKEKEEREREKEREGEESGWVTGRRWLIVNSFPYGKMVSNIATALIACWAKRRGRRRPQSAYRSLPEIVGAEKRWSAECCAPLTPLRYCSSGAPCTRPCERAEDVRQQQQQQPQELSTG